MSVPTSVVWPVVKARLTSAGITRLYDANAVPASPDYPYAVLAIDTGAPRGHMLAGGRRSTVTRASVQIFGRTISAVLDIAEKADAALDHVYLPIAGDPLCHREITTTPIRDPDDDSVLYLLHTYRWDTA